MRFYEGLTFSPSKFHDFNIDFSIDFSTEEGIFAAKFNSSPPQTIPYARLHYFSKNKCTAFGALIECLCDFRVFFNFGPRS